ncbi:MAG: quinolinate synthase NadA [Muribaculaceae bacterium]|nr:quinolinate synthase NadA [Muribaculaceae bacterium]MDE6541472.1 quinolinate synthase NadA [Muribaculaceae bacterium]
MTVEKGYVDAPVAPGTNLVEEIRRLKKEKQAVVLAHYYQSGEIQDVADMVGDSLAMAQYAATLTDARIVVVCGVHFMGETARLLCPDKKVLIPDLNAGCSLADSCPPDKFEEFVKAHPGHTVVSYVNTSVGVKALTDVVVTSGNARRVVDSLPADEKIIFGPDRNLGNYINAQTGRRMVLWDGACHVHELFSAEKIAELKAAHPAARVLVHPECKRPLTLMADCVGSTAALLKYAQESDAQEFIVATESGILHEMRRLCPDKTFIPAPPSDSTCGCNDCAYMKLITLEKLYNTLLHEMPVVEVDPALAERARRPIERMLQLS